MREVWIPSLVGELRPHSMCGEAKTNKQKKKINSVFKMKSTFMNFLLPEDI